ncbi:hypothetical protein BKA62DRAFT_6464 [Auriculariales sp. MPI-PUGE-AT-0066]|nr:hypothetical protein BKA62DRAFT_6464 [Auriculariales sp. MPI-PUGE-AT-0066]
MQRVPPTSMTAIVDTDWSASRLYNSATSLPAEIIALIIQLAAVDNWLFTVRGASVCHTWRSAVRHYPRCWSTAIAQVGHGRPIHYDYQLSKLYLRRSRQAPIQLTLDLSRASDPQSVIFLRLYSRELARCSKFTFAGPVSHKVISYAFGDLWHPYSQVQELSLTLNTGAEGFAPESMLASDLSGHGGAILLQTTFPAMRRLRLDFPVATSMPSGALVSIFHSYPNLEYLDIRLGLGMSATVGLWLTPSFQPVFAPTHLKELHLEGVSVSDLATILDFKSMQLISLYIHTLGVHARRTPATGYSNPPLPAFLCNPSSTLRSLELGGFSLSGPSFLPFMRMLRGLPELTRMALSHVRLDAQLFHTLARPMPGLLDWAVPRLEAIEFHQMMPLGLVGQRQWAWVMDVARQRNVASKCGSPVAKVAALKCDVVGRDGRVLLDLREMALAGPIGVKVSATGHSLTFFV